MDLSPFLDQVDHNSHHSDDPSQRTVCSMGSAFIVRIFIARIWREFLYGTAAQPGPGVSGSATVRVTSVVQIVVSFVNLNKENCLMFCTHTHTHKNIKAKY